MTKKVSKRAAMLLLLLLGLPVVVNGFAVVVPRRLSGQHVSCMQQNVVAQRQITELGNRIQCWGTPPQDDDGAAEGEAPQPTPSADNPVTDETNNHDSSGAGDAVRHQLEHRAAEKGALGVAQRLAEQLEKTAGQRMIERTGERAVERALERASETAAERAGEKFMERAGERALKRASETATERAGERILERAGERALERASESAAERAGERILERAGERALERASESAAERAGERILERASERALERASETAAERMGEKLVERAGERALERASESAAERAGERMLERSSERALERASESAAERAGERILERAVGESAVKRTARRAAAKPQSGPRALKRLHRFRILEQSGEVVVERSAQHAAEQASERMVEHVVERTGERTAERAGEMALGHVGSRSTEGALGKVERLLGVSTERVASRIGRGLVIALPVLGGIFAFYLFRSDYKRWKLERRSSTVTYAENNSGHMLQQRKRPWLSLILLGGAGAADLMDAVLHFFIAYGLCVAHQHKTIMLAEELSMGCAVVSTVFAVLGEIASSHRRKNLQQPGLL